MTASGQDMLVESALADIAAGREEEVLAALSAKVARNGGDPLLWHVLALAYRRAEQMGEAADCFAKAAELNPGSATIAHGLARCRFDGGLPTLGLFERAQALAPGPNEVTEGLIACLAAEQGSVAAMAKLTEMLARHPSWGAGHWLMARLIGCSADGRSADEGIRSAVRQMPGDAALWWQWARILTAQNDYAGAAKICAEAASRFEGELSFRWLRAACLSETGDLAGADAMYGGLGTPADVPNAIFLSRHHLRSGRADLVAQGAGALLERPDLEALLPYLALAWRITGDPQLQWLEPLALVGVYDLAGELPPLEELAGLLRGLHTQRAQPLEQSVRGGTQTDGPLLSRVDPLLRQLRDILRTVVRRHVEGLGPADPRHPQLRHRRDRPVRFSGSWSVRLRSLGHHSPHVHPQGWFSSALYIALPEGIGRDEDRNGWLTLGEPQASLGLDLPPQRFVEPRPGRLVLFPSTMWHGTVPFTQGERLTVAFDVARPV